MKRDLWTNEEVMAIIGGFRVSDKNYYSRTWNEAIDEMSDQFALFNLDSDISGAMAFDEKENQIVHIGPLLPE